MNMRAIEYPTPFPSRRIEKSVAAGATLAEIVDLEGVEQFCPVVKLNGEAIKREFWTAVRPKAGVTITIEYMPMGGGGGGSNVLKIVLMIAVVAFAAFVAPQLIPTLGKPLASVVGAGITLAGNLAINALIPPPSANFKGTSATADEQAFRIVGTRNQSNPFGVVPQVLGQHKIFPSYAAKPYTEIDGNDQFLRLLFAVSHGPVEMGALRIGDTPIDQYDDVEVELYNGDSSGFNSSIYPSEVSQENLSILIDKASGWFTRTTDADATEIEVDFTFQRGLVRFKNNGKRVNTTVDFEVQYAPTGTNDWTVGSNLESFADRDITIGAAPTGSPERAFERFDRIVLEKATGDLKYLKGEARQTAGFELTYGFNHAFMRRRNPQLFGTPAAPPVPRNHYPIAKIEVNHGVSVIAADKVMDERPLSDEKFLEAIGGGSSASTDFTPSADGSDMIVTVAAGDLSYPISLTDNTSSTKRFKVRFPVTKGTYDVRVRRITDDTNSDRLFDKFHWSSLRTFKDTKPVDADDIAMVAMRIRATDQLNGVVDSFNLIAHTIALDWDSTNSWWIERPTSNPASLYRHILQGSGTRNPLPDARLDIDTLKAWHEANDENGDYFNGIFAGPGTVFRRLQDVSSAGRASFNMLDGKFSVVRDIVQSAPVQHFTPRNSSDFRGTKAFHEQPHALKVRFIDPGNNWQEEERIVFDDGFSEENATIFEELKLIGVTNPEQAWRMGRYHIAVGRLRPETFQINADIENLICTRGDLVRVSHDVPSVGSGFGRIVDKGTTIIGQEYFDLDSAVSMTAGNNYILVVRDNTGASNTIALATVAGDDQTRVYLPVGETTAVTVTDRPLFMFGRANRATSDFLVKAIEPQNDLEARLTLVPAAPEVHDADTGEIPAYSPNITRTADRTETSKPVQVLDVYADSVLVGDVEQARIVAVLGAGRGHVDNNWLDRYQIEIRETGSTAWTRRNVVEAPVSEVDILGADTSLTYDVRVRGMSSATGQATPWRTISGIAVTEDVLRPDDVGSLRVNRLVLSWDYDTPPDHKGFELKVIDGAKETSWYDDAVSVSDDPIRGTSFDLSALNLPAGSYTVFIKAIDTSDRKSENAVRIIVNVGALDGADMVLVPSATRDLDDESFGAGTIEDGSTAVPV